MHDRLRLNPDETFHVGIPLRHFCNQIRNAIAFRRLVRFAMLDQLPTELLDQIVTSLPTARSISNLSQSSRSLHTFVEKEGWRAFASARFPNLDYPPYWRDASHALTTLSRNWDRRAFLSSYLEPAGDIRSVPGFGQVKQWRRPKGQTMGFRPAIDCFEEVVGNRWIDRREVLAWSAGAELLVRVKTRESEGDEKGSSGTAAGYDRHGNRVVWWTYKPPGSMEGKDDITSINLLGSRLEDSGDSGSSKVDRVIVGTENGDLKLLDVPSLENVVRTRFETRGRPVRSTTVVDSMLVANLSDTGLTLYPIDVDQTETSPISDINAIPQAKRGSRIWRTKFLDKQHLAVGLGPSVEPLHVFEVRPDGLTPEPIRKFGLTEDLDDRLDSVGTVKPTSSIYTIEPLTPSHGQLFLSGGYDGVIR